MVLPVTITGLATTTAPIGPFKVAAGNYTQTNVILSAPTAAATGIFGGTGSGGSLGQTLTNGSSSITIPSVNCYLSKAGNPTDNFYIEICATDPNGTVLATSELFSCLALTTSGAWYTLSLTAPLTIAASAVFGIRYKRTGANDNVNYPATWQGVGTSYAAGNNWTWNGTTYAAGSNDNAIGINKTVTIATDAYYIFGKDSAQAGTLKAYKATDPATSWASGATFALGSNSIQTLTGYQVGTIIHFLISEGVSLSTLGQRYITFDTSTDTFGTAEVVYASQAGAGQITSGWGSSLVVRSNGEVVAFFNGLQTKTSGTFYARVYYSRRTGNTWSAAVQVDGNTSNDNSLPNVALGSVDRVFFIWYNTLGSSVRTLTPTNTLGTANVNAALTPPGDAVSYNRAGVTTYKTVFTNSTGGQSTGRFDSGDTPVPTYVNQSIAAASAPHRIGVDSMTYDVTIVYRSSTDSGLYAIKSTDDGATFSAPVSVFVGTVAASDNNLSRSPTGSVYQRGTSRVVGYVVNDNGTWKYNEYVPPGYNAWSYADKTASITLSNNDKTATVSSAASSGVRSSLARANGTAGKYYVEFVLNNVSNDKIGLQSLALAVNSSTTNDTINFSISATQCNISTGVAVKASNLGPAVTGDIVGMAWDAGTEKIWFRVNNGLWNANAAADPVAGTNGVDVSAAAAGGYGLWFFGGSAAIGRAVTIRTEHTDCTYDVPSGFMSWVGVSPEGWNRRDVTGIITVSSTGDRLSYAAQGIVAARSVKGWSSSTPGKYYTEISNQGGGPSTLGLAPDTNVLTSITNTINCQDTDGQARLGNTVLGPVGGAHVANDRISFAWDTAAKKIWMRKNGGLWNNSATANPATNTEGYDISAAPTARYCLWYTATGTGMGAQLYDRLALFNYAVPTGYSSWMGELPPQPIADAWNFNSKYPLSPATYTFSNGDKTVAVTGKGGVRTTTSHTHAEALKFYSEFNIVGSPYGVGLVTESAVDLSQSNAGIYVRFDGAIVALSTGLGFLEAFGNGDIISFCWDGATKQVWFRRNAGLWNGSSSANPATGVGGLSITSYVDSSNYYLWMKTEDNDGTVTVRTEVADVTQTKPSGYLSWMGETLGPAAYVLTADKGNYAIADVGTPTSLRYGRKLIAASRTFLINGSDTGIPIVTPWTPFHVDLTYTQLTEDTANSLHYVIRDYTNYVPGDTYQYSIEYQGLGANPRGLQINAALPDAGGSNGYISVICSNTGADVGGEGVGVWTNRQHSVTATSNGYYKALLGGTINPTAIIAGTGQVAIYLLSGLNASYTGDGNSGVLFRNYKGLHFSIFSAANGVYGVTGRVANLDYNHRSLEANGVYSYTGQAAILRFNHRSLEANGVYGLAGQAVTFKFNHRSLEANGVYSLIGNDATLIRVIPARNLVLDASSGAYNYNLTGTGSLAVSDNFNRVDFGSLGPNWMTSIIHGGCLVSANKASATGGYTTQIWVPNTFPADQYAEINADSGPLAGPVVRYSEGVNITGYWMFRSGTTVYLYKIVDTGFTLIASGATDVSETNATFRLEAIGSSIKGYSNGRLVLDVTDTLFTSGQPGFNTNGVIDDFKAGALPVVAGTPSIAGNVAFKFNHRSLEANGVYGLAGQAATFIFIHRSLEANGVYSYTGRDATLTKGAAAPKILDAANSVFNIAGQAATFKFNHRSLEANGVYAIAGQPATFKFNHRSLEANGVYGLAGQAVTLRFNHRSLEANGVYGLAGQAVTLRFNHRSLEANGVYGLAGQAATFKLRYQLAAANSVYSYTGQTTILSYVAAVKGIAAFNGVYNYSGQVATLRAVRKLALANTIYSYTGNAAGLRLGKKVNAANSVYSYTGNATALTAKRTIALANGTYSVAGQATTLRAIRKLALANTNYIYTGNASTLRIGYKFAAANTAYSIAGKVATLIPIRKLVAANTNYSVSGKVATFKLRYQIAATQGTYTFAGQAAALTSKGRMDTGTFTITGSPAILRRSRLFPCANTFYTSTGQPASLRIGRKLSAANTVYAISGKDISYKLRYQALAAKGTYSYTGQVTTLKLAHTLLAANSSYAVIGKANNFKVRYGLAITQGTYQLIGSSAGLSQRAEYILDANVGTYNLSGRAANFKTIRGLGCQSGDYDIIASVVLKRHIHVHAMATGYYRVNGQDASLLAATGSFPGLYGVAGTPVQFFRTYRHVTSDMIITKPKKAAVSGKLHEPSDGITAIKVF